MVCVLYKYMHFCHNFCTKNQTMTKLQTLFLIPMPISEIDNNWTIPLNVINQVKNIQYFIVENSKTSRHFLKAVNPEIDWSQIHIFELDKHQPDSQKNDITQLLRAGHDIGLMSEAGMPCIADPGHHVVRIAHEHAIKVKPLVGPSSILMALISSGLNGQSFKFNGYLPANSEEKKKVLLRLEKESALCTQLFIEAPYRNDKLFQDALQMLNGNTRLLVAKDICGEEEYIVCKKIADWKKEGLSIGKIPCLFAIGAQ